MVRGECSLFPALFLDFYLRIPVVGVQSGEEYHFTERVNALIHAWYRIRVSTGKIIQHPIVSAEAE